MLLCNDNNKHLDFPVPPWSVLSSFHTHKAQAARRLLMGVRASSKQSRVGLAAQAPGSLTGMDWAAELVELEATGRGFRFFGRLWADVAY